MSKYTKFFTASTEFDGDTVTVKMSRLKRKHLLDLAGTVAKDPNTGNWVPKVSENAMLEAAIGPIRDCTAEINGLKDADGVDIPIEDVLEDAYFMPLSLWLLSTLMENSRLGDSDEKKSEPQLVAP